MKKVYLNVCFSAFRVSMFLFWMKSNWAHISLQINWVNMIDNQGRIPMLRGLRHTLGARPPCPQQPNFLTLKFKENKKTIILNFYCNLSYIFPLISEDLSFLIPSFLPPFPSLFFSLFFLHSLFSLSLLWKPHKVSEGPWGARPPEARGLRPVPFVPLRGSGTGFVSNSGRFGVLGKQGRANQKRYWVSFVWSIFWVLLLHIKLLHP